MKLKKVRIILLLVMGACLFSTSYSATVKLAKGITPEEKTYLKKMKNQETKIKSGLRLSPSSSCGELSRSIKEHEEGIWMLGDMIVVLKKQLKSLQQQLSTDLVQQKIELRMRLYKDWQNLMQQFKGELATLKQKATDKRCSPNQINPCSKQPGGQLRCR